MLPEVKWSLLFYCACVQQLFDVRLQIHMTSERSVTTASTETHVQFSVKPWRVGPYSRNSIPDSCNDKFISMYRRSSEFQAASGFANAKVVRRIFAVEGSTVCMWERISEGSPLLTPLATAWRAEPYEAFHPYRHRRQRWHIQKRLGPILTSLCQGKTLTVTSTCEVRSL